MAANKELWLAAIKKRLALRLIETCDYWTGRVSFQVRSHDPAACLPPTTTTTGPRPLALGDLHLLDK